MLFQYGHNLKNGIYECDFFRKKKVLVLVPHEDDELITIGTFIPILQSNKCLISVAFATNGDYHGKDKAFVRIKEAISYCTSVGVCEENIFFMGFGDQGEKAPHIYNAYVNVIAPSGESQTYGLKSHETYAKQKYGKELTYNRENYKKELKDIILEVDADIIFSIDCDIHSDHIALSLMFEEVMTEIVQEKRQYPLVLKMFAHDMLWMGVEDFYAKNLKSCIPTKNNPHHTYADKFFEAYYPWEKRVRFPIYNGYLGYLGWNNSYRNLMKIYKSQYVPYHFSRLLNADQVFWIRRTDNLLLQSRVIASSGDILCFQTMKMFECENVCLKTELLERSRLFWMPEPEDQEKRVTFWFDEEKTIDRIVIYPGFHVKSIKDAVIKIGEKTIHAGKLKGYGHPNEVCLRQPISCEKIELKFVGEKVELIKVEAYEPKTKKLYYLKIMVEDEFIYRYCIDREKRLKLKIYCWTNNGSQVYQPDDNRFAWYDVTNGKKEKIVDVIQNCWKNGTTKLRLEYQENSELYDEVEIVKGLCLKERIMGILGKIEYWNDKVRYKIIRSVKRR